MLARNTMQSLFTATALLLLTLQALAAPGRDRNKHSQGNRDYHRSTQRDLNSLQLPLSNGSATLPPPSGKLKAITLGFGTQNYTCNSTTPTPVLVGAKAVLFDLSPFLPWVSPFLSQLPSRALDINMDKVATELHKAGNHIFNGLGTPCFNLGDLGDFQGKKVPGADLVAPKGSSQGDNGLGSVNWLKLSDAGGSQGIKEAYRVNTAGGKPPASCEGQDEELTSPYASLYWFYEG